MWPRYGAHAGPLAPRPSMRKTRPASGWRCRLARSSPCRAVVTNSVERPAPPNAQEVGRSTNGHRGQQGSVGSVAAQCAAAPEGDPDVAAIVDGEAVGCDAFPVDAHDGAAVVEVPGDGIEVERVDGSSAAVGQVHGGAVRTPADAVGDGEAGEHGRARAVQLQSEERTRAGRLVVGHRSGPESPLRVAGTVVHADVRASAFGLSQLADCSLRVGEQKAGARCHHVASADDGSGSADVTADR